MVFRRWYPALRICSVCLAATSTPGFGGSRQEGSVNRISTKYFESTSRPAHRRASAKDRRLTAHRCGWRRSGCEESGRREWHLKQNPLSVAGWIIDDIVTLRFV